MPVWTRKRLVRRLDLKKRTKEAAEVDRLFWEPALTSSRRVAIPPRKAPWLPTVLRAWASARFFDLYHSGVQLRTTARPTPSLANVFALLAGVLLEPLARAPEPTAPTRSCAQPEFTVTELRFDRSDIESGVPPASLLSPVWGETSWPVLLRPLLLEASGVGAAEVGEEPSRASQSVLRC